MKNVIIVLTAKLVACKSLINMALCSAKVRLCFPILFQLARSILMPNKVCLQNNMSSEAADTNDTYSFKDTWIIHYSSVQKFHSPTII